MLVASSAFLVLRSSHMSVAVVESAVLVVGKFCLLILLFHMEVGDFAVNLMLALVLVLAVVLLHKCDVADDVLRRQNVIYLCTCIFFSLHMNTR